VLYIIMNLTQFERIKSQGHIHNYVYKLEDICAKAAEWTGSRVSSRSRGFSARFARYRSDLKDSGELKGVMCKVATSSSSFYSEQKTGGGGFLRAALANGGTSDWDGEDHNLVGEKEMEHEGVSKEGSPVAAREGVAEISAGGGAQGGRLGSNTAAALRCWADDEER
jgi:hypothetical protein